MKRTPEFTKREIEVLRWFILVWIIFGTFITGVVEDSRFSNLSSVALTGSTLFSFLVIYPMMLKAKIKEFPRWYWRIHFFGFGSFWGIWLLLSIAVLISR